MIWQRAHYRRAGRGFQSLNGLSLELALLVQVQAPAGVHGLRVSLDFISYLLFGVAICRECLTCVGERMHQALHRILRQSSLRSTDPATASLDPTRRKVRQQRYPDLEHTWIQLFSQ